jgi:hypothetical protein
LSDVDSREERASLQRGHTVEVLEQRRRHLFKLGVNLVESLATTLISHCRVEKIGEVLHESAVDHVSNTLKLVRQSTVHVYRRNLPGLSCPQRLSGQFFALEDLGNLWRLEDGPDLDGDWRLGGVGVHRPSPYRATNERWCGSVVISGPFYYTCFNIYY